MHGQLGVFQKSYFALDGLWFLMIEEEYHSSVLPYLSDSMPG